VITSFASQTNVLSGLFVFTFLPHSMTRLNVCFTFLPHSMTRLNICRVAGERIDFPVFFVGESHPVLSGDDTARDHYFLAPMMYDRDGCDDSNRCSRCNHDQDFLRVVCASGNGEAHTQNDNQNSTQKNISWSSCPRFARRFDCCWSTP
jgi:hypothetical protein